jgi:hypothetical protein
VLVGRHALPEHLIHIMLDGETSISETPKVIGNLFMAFCSRQRRGTELLDSKTRAYNLAL